MATAEKVKEKNPVAIFNTFLEDRTGQLSKVLPKHIPVARFQRIILTAVQLNPDLLACNRQSLWNSAMRAAQDGLLPDNRDGALVAFKDMVQWMPMVGGLLKRFRNSGQFKSITTNIVREGEFFEYFIDENGEHLKHIPGDGSGRAIKAYAAATLVNGGTMIKVMNENEINKRRNMSRAKNSPLWSEWVDEAWQKTTLRNLAKRLPMSSDLDDLVCADDALYDFETPANPTHITSVSSTLDSFSGSSQNRNPIPESESAVNSKPPPVSEPRDKSNPANARAAANESTVASEPYSGSNPASPSEDDEAYDLGVEARRDGMARKAVPPEYREPDKSHLARAWQRGWDSE